MPDYKKMYQLLLLEVNDTIEQLQKALYKAEDIYIDSAEEIDEIKNG